MKKIKALCNLDLKQLKLKYSLSFLKQYKYKKITEK